MPSSPDADGAPPAATAASTLIFSRLPLAEALARLAALGFGEVELAAVEGWAHVGPRALAAAPGAVTAEVRAALAAAGVRAVAVNAGFGDAPAEAHFERTEGLARLAAAIGARVLTIPAAAPPGPAVLAGAAAEIRRLEALVGICRRHAVALAVECHIGALTEDPATAAALCRAVPGLRLTLDPSHYWAGPAQGRGWEEVLPHVAHVHLRDAGTAGWSEIQAAPGRGAVDFRAVAAGLRAAAYRGACSIEYIDTLPVLGGTTAAEAAVAMRERLRSVLPAAGA